MSSSLGFRNQWTNPLVAFRASEHSLPILQSGSGLIVSRPICYHVEALKSAPNSDTVVAADNSYGRKEVISVNPRLYDYLLANVREPKVLVLSSHYLVFVFLSLFCGHSCSCSCSCCYNLTLHFRYCVSSERKLLLCMVARCRYS